MVNSSGRKNRTRTKRLSTIKSRLPSKVVFHQRSSSIEGRLPSNVVFYRRSFSAPELHPKWIKQNELGRLDNESLGKKRPDIRHTTYRHTTYTQKLTCRSSANFVSAGQKYVCFSISESSVCVKYLCVSIDATPAQPQRTSTVIWCDMKMILYTPTTETQCSQYLSCYLAEFD